MGAVEPIAGLFLILIGAAISLAIAAVVIFVVISIMHIIGAIITGNDNWMGGS